MELGFIMVLALAVPILFWVALIWAGAFSGLHQAIRNTIGQAIRGRRIDVFGAVRRIIVRPALIISVPVAVYAFLVWFLFESFGWEAAISAALALPIILLGTVLVWAGVVSGLAQVALDALRRRVTASPKRETRVAEELVPRRIG